MENVLAEGVYRRLDRLERQNRRMKQAGISMLLVLSVVLLTAQVRPEPRTVIAQKFILEDASGHERALLELVGSHFAAMKFLGESGQQDLVLQAGEDTTGHGHGWLQLGHDRGQYVLAGSRANDESLTLSDGGLLMSGRSIGSVILSAPGTSGPSLDVTDSQGYRTTLGVTDIITPTTGEKRTTSAASLVLFGKDGEVIWSAP